MKAVEASASRRLFEKTLNTYYIPLEVWYMRTIIDKVCLWRHVILIVLTRRDCIGASALET